MHVTGMELRWHLQGFACSIIRKNRAACAADGTNKVYSFTCSIVKKNRAACAADGTNKVYSFTCSIIKKNRAV